MNLGMLYPPSKVIYATTYPFKSIAAPQLTALNITLDIAIVGAICLHLYQTFIDAVELVNIASSKKTMLTSS